jgi:hypothetical protein
VILDTLLSYPWLVALVWIGLALFDYVSTRWLARAYRSVLSRNVVFEGGVELNPVFEKEVAGGRAISLRYVLSLVFYFAIFLFTGWAGRPFVELIAGGLLLTWIFIDLRHLHNYAYTWHLRLRPESLQGRVEYSYWLLQRLVSIDAFNFVILYGLLALLTGRLFFVAGALGCSALALRHYRLAKREPPAAGPAD